MANQYRWLPTTIKSSLVAIAAIAAGCQSPLQSQSYQNAVGEYHQMVNYLSSDQLTGRGVGTRGIDVARDYIASEFQSYGLEPMVIDKNKKSYNQKFPINTGSTLTAKSLYLNNKKLNLDTDFAIMGFSGSADFQGPAVFTGYCINNPDKNYDSFQGENDTLKGKVAIAFRYEPQKEGKSIWAEKSWTKYSSMTAKAKLAAEQGATALIVVTPPSQDKGRKLRRTTSSRFTSATIPVVQITSEQLTAILKSNNAPSPQKLQSLSDEKPTTPLLLAKTKLKGDIKFEKNTIDAYNVVSVLPGAGALKNQYIVIGGHYDHLGQSHDGHHVHGSRHREKIEEGGDMIHNGADDNASGTAGVIMAAKYFARRVQDGHAPASRRSIIFTAFSGEERGLLGSKYMTKNLHELGISPSQINTMVNFDMIGRLGKPQFQIFGTDTCKEFKPLITQATHGTGLSYVAPKFAPGGSDHTSFHNIGVPAVFFFTGLHADYHKPSDHADKINGHGAIKIVKVACNHVENLWSRHQALEYAK